MRELYTENAGIITKIKQISTGEWPVYSYSTYRNRGINTTNSEKTASICPKNTFKISHEPYKGKSSDDFYKNHEYDHCFCLGWYASQVQVVDHINVTDYDTKIPCGIPKCEKESLDRYAVLRRAELPNYNTFVNSTFAAPYMKVDGLNISTTCYAGMTAKYAKIEDSHWDKYSTGYSGYSGYSGIYYGSYSKKLPREILDSNNTISYQCQRIGQFVPNKTTTNYYNSYAYNSYTSGKNWNTYHLQVDGAFIAEPGWMSNFRAREIQMYKDLKGSYYGSYYGGYSSYYSSYSALNRVKYYKAKGYVEPKYFGNKFTGKMCDNDDHLSLSLMLSDNLENCTVSCQGKCVEVNEAIETALNNKVTGNYTDYRSYVSHIGKFYCKCSEGQTGRNCEITKVAPSYALKGNGSGKGWLIAGILILILVLIGLIVLVGFIRNYSGGQFDIYNKNAGMNVHYTDLEEDRNVDFPDNRDKLNTFDPFDTVR